MSPDVELVEARLARTYRDRVLPAVEAESCPVVVEACALPGEPVPFASATDLAFAPFAVGTPWGRPWGTTWFRVSGVVPRSWSGGAELAVDLGFRHADPGFQAEALVRRPDGGIVKAVEPLNAWVPVEAAPGERFTLYLEAASNPDLAAGWTFAPTPLGDPATAGGEALYRLRRLELVRRDPVAAALERDWAVLTEVMRAAPPESPRRAGILRALERAADALDPADPAGTVAAARRELAAALASPAVASAHRVAAVGHAHIDSAWLWPLRETVRKVTRTFSNVLDLMDRYPGFVFAASAAQHFRWVQEHEPALFARLRERVREGRFVVVGGMWVESDTNLPGGEALVRQLLHGQRYFLRELGVEARVGWLPDSFGYSAALPQLLAGSGLHDFLTQKISWNETNDFPHNTFWWEGLDGTRVFTHFPPVDTYGSDLSATDLERAQRQNAERGRSNLSLVPFGYGDGGGGPTREMLESAARKADLEGSPRVEHTAPADFFAASRAALPDPAVWSGELYLELHRGTYTSQAPTKLGNRRSEHLLREAELWAATAAVRRGAAYPADALRRLWERVLLLQFHDILPGSSIAWVHREAERAYAEITAELESIVDDAVRALAGGAPAHGRVLNPAPVPVQGVPALGSGTPSRADASVRRAGDAWVLESPALVARVDARGEVVSLVHRPTGREVVAPGGVGNALQLFRDTPTRWDAWDVDAHYARTPVPLAGSADVAAGEDGSLRVGRAVGASSVAQVLRMSPDGTALDIETTVDWRESQRLLKLAFWLDVRAEEALSEIQFGHVRRPTHRNTSWDAARFETVAHRWVHVEEPGLGVTVANDRVYGHDVSRVPRPGGGIATLLRASLLRSPTFPDPTADRGTHVFRHAISVGDVLDGVAEGYRLNLPLRPVAGLPEVEPLVRVEGSRQAVVEAVKLAEDGSGDVVVRVYEAAGGRVVAGRLVPRFPYAAVARCDLLERPLAPQPDDPLLLELGPFQVVTVRLRRA